VAYVRAVARRRRRRGITGHVDFGNDSWVAAASAIVASTAKLRWKTRKDVRPDSPSMRLQKLSVQAALKLRGSQN
jgi:hypothetical protein